MEISNITKIIAIFTEPSNNYEIYAVGKLSRPPTILFDQNLC